jgi:hypothetical protein
MDLISLVTTIPMRYLFLLITCCTFQLRAQQETTVFTREQLIADIQYCRNFHEKYNTNLYAYHSKAVIDSLFEAMEANVSPMNAMSFYAYLSPITSTISDGHCLLFPPESWTKSADTTKGFFPFRIRYEDHAFYITMNLSDISSLYATTPIQSINGISADSIYHAVLGSLPREGNNLQYPNWIIEKYFYEYYSYIYGHPESFELSTACNIDSVSYDSCVLMNVPAVTKDTLVERRKKRYPDYPMTSAREKGLDFHSIDSIDAAVLTIFTWDKELLRKNYGIRFKDSIDQYFERATKDSVETLIIDLRNNQGGYMMYGVHVMQWLMDTSFNYLDKIEKSKTTILGRRKFRNVSTARFTHVKPFENHYMGKVIVLTNGGTFSNSSIFAAQLQRNGRATIMGEESGGSATQLTGSFGMHKQLVMPNTKIEMSHINYRIVVNADLPYSGAGVQPDIPIADDWNEVDGDVLMHKVIEIVSGK